MIQNHNSCFWDESIHKCYRLYDESTSSTVGSPILVLILTLTFIAPIKVIVEDIIVNWLRPPLNNSTITKTKKVSSSSLLENFKSLLVSFRIFRKRRYNARRVYVTSNVDDSEILVLQKKLRSIANSLMTKKISQYFLSAWGLDDKYRFVAVHDCNTNSSEIMRNEMDYVRSESSKLIDDLNTKAHTNDDVRYLLLKLFIKDLMRLNGQNTLSLEYQENYINNDNDDKIYSNITYRILGWVIIIGINIGMIYYIIISQTLQSLGKHYYYYYYYYYYY